MSRRSIRDRGACPLCAKPALPAHRPFCSQGCRDRDLLAWLDGGYGIPGPAVDPDEIAADGLDSEAARRL